MVRIFLFLIFILLVIWLLRPFLKVKDEKKNNSKLKEILNADQSNFRQPNYMFIIIIIVVSLFLFAWLLPKFGINLIAYIRKIVALLSRLRRMFIT